MKKFLAILFTILYVTAASGTPVYLQYCKGRLVNLNIGLGKNADCDQCPFEKDSKDCCDVEQQQLKAAEFSSSPVINLSNLFIQAVASVNFLRIPVPPVSSVQVAYPTINGPPEAGKIALFIKHCTFRI